MTPLELPVSILGTHTVLPGRCVTTAEVARKLGKPKKTARYEELTGVRTRYWAEPGTRLSPLAAGALRGALDEAGLAATDLRRIILVYSGGADLTFPATATLVAWQLGLRGSCDAFDLKNACIGFVSAFDLAARSVMTGLGPVGIVSAELNSRFITPTEPRPYLVFGDAVAAAVVGPSRGGAGVIASFLANDGSHPPDVFGDEPSLTRKLEYIQFTRTSKDIAALALAGLRAGLADLLARAQVALRDVEWVVLHQPNGAMLDAIIESLEIHPARVVRVVDAIGSVASASIPVCLDRLRKTRALQPGDRILILGVGGGISYGGILYRVGA
jgi:3-oxoacyl-(acyl-carrier-protein) synthase III